MCMAEQVTAKKDAKTQQLKVPPHSFEAEQSVLGGLMLDNDAWDRVANGLSIRISTAVRTG